MSHYKVRSSGCLERSGSIAACPNVPLAAEHLSKYGEACDCKRSIISGLMVDKEAAEVRRTVGGNSPTGMVAAVCCPGTMATYKAISHGCIRAPPPAQNKPNYFLCDLIRGPVQ